MTDTNPNSRFRILSVEGGGILGAFAAGALAQMEHTTGRRIVDHFDLIAGTSTGSIIAALLVKGWAVQEVIDLYRQLAGEVFAPRWWELRLGACLLYPFDAADE